MATKATLRVEKTKQKILKAAYEIMLKNGVAETTMMEVAKRSKTSHPLVTYHFADINKLYIGVIESILEELREATIKAIEKEHKNMIELLRAYSRVYFDWGKVNQDKFRLWIYFYYLATLHPEYTALNDEIRRVGRERIENILLKGIAFGEFKKKSSKEIKELSYSIQGLITGGMIMVSSESVFSYDEVANMIGNTIEQLLA